MRTLVIAGLFALAAAPASAQDVDVSQLANLEGWTLYSVTQVDGEFDGCEPGRYINYVNGMHTICDDVDVDSDVEPDALIFTKAMRTSNGTMVMVRVLIDGDIYEMRPIFRQRKK